jgi:hypothetical protein
MGKKRESDDWKAHLLDLKKTVKGWGLILEIIISNRYSLILSYFLVALPGRL